MAAHGANGNIARVSVDIPEEDPVIAGYLLKKGQINPNWKKRYFRLIQGNLFYHLDDNPENVKGVISLRGVNIRYRVMHGDDDGLSWDPSSSPELSFAIQTTGRVYMLQGQSPEHSRAWVEALERASVAAADEVRKSMYLTRHRGGQARPPTWSAVVLGAKSAGSYTVYEVFGTHSETGTITRHDIRYSALLQMHQALCQQYPSLMAGISFPPKKLIGNRLKTFVEKRRAALNCYMSAIMLTPELADSSLVRNTLQLQERGITNDSQVWLRLVKGDKHGTWTALQKLPDEPLWDKSVAELSIACLDLPEMEHTGGGQTNPFVVMFKRPDDHHRRAREERAEEPSLTSFDSLPVTKAGSVCVGRSDWEECDRTELCLGTKAPAFSSTFPVGFELNLNHQLRFCVYHMETGVGGHVGDVPLASPECALVGQATASLADVVGNLAVDLELAHPKAKLGRRGTLRVTLKQSFFSNFRVSLRFGMNDIPLGTRLFLEIARERGDHGFQTVFRSPTTAGLPRWSTFELSAQALSSGEPGRLLKISVFMWAKDGRHVPLGSTESSLLDMVRQGCCQCLPLALPSRADPKRKEKIAPYLVLEYINVAFSPTVLDYAKGGKLFKLFFGVDFTASNGPANMTSSLHYSTDELPSMYEQLMQGIVNALAPLADTEDILAYGFGAQFAKEKKLNLNAFPLSQTQSRVSVKGFAGLQSAYKQVLQDCSLFAPGVMLEVIERASTFAQLLGDPVAQDTQFCLAFILTDGVNGDLKECVRGIQRLADEPVFFNIIGVSHDDFEPMKAYNQRTGEGFQPAQFVPALDYVRQGHEAEDLPLFVETLLQPVSQRLLQWAYASKRLPSSVMSDR